MEIVIGFDIGGTKIAVAVADVHGHILDRSEFATPISLKDGLEVLEQTGVQLAGQNMAVGIGVSIGGPINRQSGRVSPLHQPQWRDVALQDFLQQRFHSPVDIEVDTDAAAFAEYWLGDTKPNRLLYLTLSTGMGGGFMVDGAIYRGVGGVHPEVAHQSINYRCRYPQRIVCECGAPDCLEALVSGNGIRRVYGKPAEELLETEWEEVAANLGQGIRNLCSIYAPERIALGGGVAIGGGAILLKGIQQVLDEHLFLVPKAELCLSKFGRDTALYGAVTLGQRAAGKR